MFSKSARFLVQGAEACLARLPAHRPIFSDTGLEAAVWTKPKIGTAPTDCVFGPRMCARAEIEGIDKLVSSMERTRPGNMII